MKKRLYLIAVCALALCIFIPSSSVKAASKSAPNNVKSMQETYYDAVTNLLTDGRLDMLFYDAERAEGVPYNLMAKPKKIAVVEVGEANPILLVSGADPDEKETWYLKKDMTLETLHSFKYNEETGSFEPSKLEFSLAPFGRAENFELTYSNIFLSTSKKKKGASTYFTVVSQSKGMDAYWTDVFADLSKYNKYTDAATLVKKLTEGKAIKEIKWYKVTNAKGFRKDYKSVVKKSYKDKRTTYYKNKNNPLYLVPYKVTGGTLKVNTGKDYTEYVFTGVNNEDYSGIHSKAAKGAVLKLRDGASTTDTVMYCFLDGKKVSVLTVTSYIDVDERNWNKPAPKNISVRKSDKLGGRGTIYYITGMGDDEKKKCNKMSDADFIKYLLKNYDYLAIK